MVEARFESRPTKLRVLATAVHHQNRHFLTSELPFNVDKLINRQCLSHSQGQKNRSVFFPLATEIFKRKQLFFCAKKLEAYFYSLSFPLSGNGP